MATENIRINYQVDKSQLESANKELKKAAEGNKLTQKEVESTNEKFKDQSKTLASTNRAFAGLGGQLTALGNKFQIAGRGLGDMASGMFAVTTATQGTSKAMRILKVAIASTGIGALVIALASLISAFKSSEAGQNKFKKLMDIIGVVLGNLSDILATLGEKIITAFENPKKTIKEFIQLIKDNLTNRLTGILELLPKMGQAIQQVFKGDFSGAAKTAGDAVAKVTLGVENFTDKAVAGFNAATEAAKEFIDQTDKEIKQAQALADKRAATDLLEREFIIKTAELESKVADLRLKARQEDEYTAAERLKFLNEANKLQNELIDTELIIAKNRAEEQTIQNTFSKSTKENLDEEARLIAEVSRVEAKRLNEQRQLQREINTVSKQAEAALEQERKLKEAIAEMERKEAEEKKMQEQEELQAKIDAENELTIFRLEQQQKLIEAELLKRDILLENEQLLADERALIIEESEARINQIKKASADSEIQMDKAVAKAKEEALMQSLSLAKDLFNEQTVAYKAASIAQIGISTYKAAAAALEPPPTGAGPLLGPILAGLTIASGVRNAAKVAGLNPKFEKGGRIGGNLHRNGGTVIEAERDEYVMSRKATAKYGFDFMDKVNNLELRDITPKSQGSSINLIDVNPIAKQLKEMPQNIINIDGEGFTLQQRRGHHIINRKLNRYTT